MRSHNRLCGNWLIEYIALIISILSLEYFCESPVIMVTGREIKPEEVAEGVTCICVVNRTTAVYVDSSRRTQPVGVSGIDTKSCIDLNEIVVICIATTWQQCSIGDNVVPLIRVTPNTIYASIKEQDKQFRDTRSTVITITKHCDPLVLTVCADHITHCQGRNTKGVTQIFHRPRRVLKILSLLTIGKQSITSGISGVSIIFISELPHNDITCRCFSELGWIRNV